MTPRSPHSVHDAAGDALYARRRSFVRAIGWRLLGIVGVLWATATIAFVVLRVLPGDPIDVMLGPTAAVSDEVRSQLRASLNLDAPLPVQYIDYLFGLMRGDLGESYQLRLPVAEVIARQLAPTVALAGAALLFALVLAVVSALLSRQKRFRPMLETAELVVLSSPVFWIGLLMLSVFSFTLHWFPVGGAGGFSSLVLPALTLALPISAFLGNVLREGLDEAEAQPFTTTVLSRGSTSTRLLFRHSLRHASTGALTFAAYLAGSLLGGVVLVETVFARPGLGRVALAAIVDRDLPVVTGLILGSALVFAVLSLLVEVAHGLIDPRIRTSGATW